LTAREGSIAFVLRRITAFAIDVVQSKALRI
jgi:hypothetical protein